jgi:sugar lactone lactonase YvrE
MRTPRELFERQYVRLSGAADFVRAPDRPRGALRVSGEPTVLASTYEGKRLNAPNDVIVNPNGAGFCSPIPVRQPHVLRGTVRELELPTSVYHIDPQTAA